MKVGQESCVWVGRRVSSLQESCPFGIMAQFNCYFTKKCYHTQYFSKLLVAKMSRIGHLSLMYSSIKTWNMKFVLLICYFLYRLFLSVTVNHYNNFDLCNFSYVLILNYDV